MFKYITNTLALTLSLCLAAWAGLPSLAQGASTAATGCNDTGKPYSAVTVVLVDRTDMPSDPTKLSQFMDRIAAMVKQGEFTQGERVVLATIRGHSTDSEVLVDMVSPKEGWTSVPREVKREKRRLATCIQSTGAAFARTQVSESLSPIIETLQFAAAPVLSAKPGIARRLIVFSDMAQNGEQLSFYRKGGETVPEQTLATARHEKLIPSMRGVEVYVSGAGGTMPETQARRAAEFWRLYFGAVGASLKFYGANASF